MVVNQQRRVTAVLLHSNVLATHLISNEVQVLRLSRVTAMLLRSNVLATHLISRVTILLLINSNVIIIVLLTREGRDQIRVDHDQLLLIVKGEQANRPNSRNVLVQDMLHNAQEGRMEQGHNRGLPHPRISVQECVQGIQEQREIVPPAEDSRAVLEVERVQVEDVQVGDQPHLHRKHMNDVHQSSKRNQLVPSLFQHRLW
jgi:hypothetical protein